MRLVTLACFLGASCGGDGGGRDAAPILNCEATTTGCWCDETLPDELTECSVTSVAGPGATGYCCKGDRCSCYSVECWQATDQDCRCGKSAIVVAAVGKQVDICTNDTCCHDPVFNYCNCSVGACSLNELPVPNCNPDRVANCGDDEDHVFACR